MNNKVNIGTYDYNSKILLIGDSSVGKTDIDLEKWNMVQISKFIHANPDDINNLIEKIIEMYNKN